MALCATLAGIALDCRDNVGGIETIYIQGVSGSISFTTPPVTGSVGVADILFDSIAGTTTLAEFEKYDLVKQTGALSEAGTFSDENGTVFFTSTVTAVFNKMDAAKLTELYALAVAAKLVVLVKDNNGVFWMIGNERGAVATSSTEDTGTAFGDRNGITMVFTGIDNTPMLKVDDITV